MKCIGLDSSGWSSKINQGISVIQHFHRGKLNYVIYNRELEKLNFSHRGVALQARFLPGNSPGWSHSGALWQSVLKSPKNPHCVVFIRIIPLKILKVLTDVSNCSYQRHMGPSIKYIRKIFEKLTFLTPWYAHVRTCAYQGVKNVTFSENFACVLNGWPLHRFKSVNLSGIMVRK